VSQQAVERYTHSCEEGPSSGGMADAGTYHLRACRSSISQSERKKWCQVSLLSRAGTAMWRGRPQGGPQTQARTTCGWVGTTADPLAGSLLICVLLQRLHGKPTKRMLLLTVLLALLLVCCCVADRAFTQELAAALHCMMLSLQLPACMPCCC
jgi:hypothetical protein